MRGIVLLFEDIKQYPPVQFAYCSYELSTVGTNIFNKIWFLDFEKGPEINRLSISMSIL